MNLHSSYKVTKNVEVFGLVRNLFNQHYFTQGTFFQTNALPYLNLTDPRTFLPGMPLAVYAGVAAIVGAFLAGMALSEAAEGRVKELTHGVAELLVPFFLVGIGLQFDVAGFGHIKTFAFASVVVVAAVASKFLGCGLGSLSIGRSDAVRVGVGMIPRGEVGMVVAQIGVNVGVIAHKVYGTIVLMSVATTLIAPPLLKLAFRGVEVSEAPRDTISKT